MDVSIIMINYNTFELASDAINSIFEHSKGFSYEIILIDNLSPDGSGEKLENTFKDKIIYVQAGANLGTSKAFNIGAKKALGKYILWLNTDILIKENFILKLFTFMEENLTCGICGGNIFDFNGKPTHSFKRRIPSLKTLKKDNSIVNRLCNKVFKKYKSTQFNFTGKPLAVGYITGADMMIRSSIFEEIGYFDEDIFMYAEETEFTYRVLTKTDYKVISVPNAHIFHLEGASFKRNENNFSERRCKMKLMGNSIYFKKCYGIKSVRKYVKLELKACRKYFILYSLLLKRNKALEYKQSYATTKEFLKNLNI